MIQSRKGIISLPIKLTVSFMIIALMVPGIMNTVDIINEDVETRQLVAAADILGDQIDRVGSKGPGYKVSLMLDIPDHGYLEIGGAEGTAIRAMSEGHQVGRVFVSSPVTGSTMSLGGAVFLSIHNDPEGNGVVVERL